MSPRAAWRLEALGFTEVYDYVAGKADWSGAGLPVEGTVMESALAGEAAERDAPTCSLTDDLTSVRARVRSAGWDTCLVVNEERVVLGRLGRAALETDDRASVEEAMTNGPGTVRPDEPLEPLVARLRQRELTQAVVTTSDGRLVGVVRID